MVHGAVQAKKQHISMCLHSAVHRTEASKANYYLQLMDFHMKLCTQMEIGRPQIVRAICQALPGKLICPEEAPSHIVCMFVSVFPAAPSLCSSRIIAMCGHKTDQCVLHSLLIHIQYHSLEILDTHCCAMTASSECLGTELQGISCPTEKCSWP